MTMPTNATLMFDLHPDLHNFHVDAKMFGAVGDGVTNDTAAIQAALDSGGSVVFLPAGSYPVTTGLEIPSGVSLVGAGIDATIIKANAADITTVGIAGSAEQVSIQDLTINGNRAAYSAGQGIGLGCTGGATELYLRRIKVTNGQRFSIFLDTTTGGYSRVRVTDCIIEDSGNAYDTFGSGQLQESVISGCVFRNTTGQGFATTDADGLVISDCVFEGPMGNAISLEPAQNVLIRGCVIHNLNSGAVGIYVRPVPGLASDPLNIVITGNLIHNTGTATSLTDYGIVLRNTSYASVTGNVIRRMGVAGLSVDAMTIADSADTTRGITITGNVITDSNQDNAANTPNLLLQHLAGTVTDIIVSGNNLSKVGGDSHATHGILEVGTVSQAEYVGNDVRGVGTAGIGFGSGTTSAARHNRGFNPQGAATIAVGASPFTYTNLDNVPEAVYIRAGTVSVVAKNSRTIFVASPCTVFLEPGEAVTVTYSSAPTMEKDRK